ncbi:MAG: two-component regulator propeller domain-containing protein [Planctomycetota bacterium]
MLRSRRRATVRVAPSQEIASVGLGRTAPWPIGEVEKPPRASLTYRDARCRAHQRSRGPHPVFSMPHQIDSRAGVLRASRASAPCRRSRRDGSRRHGSRCHGIRCDDRQDRSSARVGCTTSARRSLGAVLAFAACTVAQQPPTRLPCDGVEYRIEHWGTEVGLPQNSVTCLAETRDTHLWVGTFGGLARFDGEALHEIVLPDACGLGSIRFLSLHEDPATGDLWIGTLGGGVVRRSGETAAVFGRAHGLPGDSVYAIASDSDDLVWVATEAGVAWFGDGRFHALPELAGVRSLDLARCADGRVVLASIGGAFRLQVGSVERLLDAAVSTVTEDSLGRLWCARQRDVRMCEAGAWRRLEVVGADELRIDTVRADRAGGVWFGTNCGAVRLDAGRVVATLDMSGLRPAGDPDAAVQAILEDRDGSVWIGWSMHGLQRARTAHTHGFRIRARPELSEAYVIASDGCGGLWLGGRGLAQVRDGQMSTVETPGIVCDDVRALLPVDDGLWFADSTGVYHRSGGGIEVFGEEHGLPPVPKRALLRTRADELWVGTDHGLFARRGERFVEVAGGAVERSPVLAMAHGGDDSTWVGGPSGVWLLDRTGQVVEAYRANESLPPCEIRALVPAADDGVWVVTYGCGLLRLSHGSVDRVGSAQGLLDDALCTALRDGDDLFLSSNLGLFRCNLVELDTVARGGGSRVACQRLVGSPRVADEGAGGNQPSACRDRDGTLWFLTIDGVAGVRPSELRSESTALPYCGIRGVVVGDDVVEPNADLVLSPGARDITVRLGGTGFDPAVQPRFQWRLLEADATWQTLATGREVHLQSLPPGEHSFEARSADWRGVWSRPAFLRVVVPQILTERTWFRVTAISAFAALCAGLMLFGVRRGARRSRRLALEVESRTGQLTAEIERHRATTGKLRAVRDELEQRVRQRTDELVESLQRQRQDEVERAQLESRMQHLQRVVGVGALAGGIAHDFNDLLTVVLGSATLLRGDLGDDHAAAGLLDEILEAGRRGSALAHQLLTLSARQVVAKTLLDLNDVVPRFASTLRRVLGDGIRLDIELATQPARVLAAVVQIEQVLRNLADNARDAMPAGGRLHVAVQVVEEQGGRSCVRVAVADDGVGMPPEVRARALEPFFTTKPEARTGGLGLSAVAGIVRQLGGNLSIDSAVGVGTTVAIVVPASDPVVDADRSRSAPRVGGGPILLVEDDPAVRHVVQLLLEELGHEVEAVPSGEAALAALEGRADRYGLVLSDLMMPGLHGIELACALRAAAPTVSLVFMSGCWELLETHQELLGPVLSKPPTIDALRAAIDRSLLGGRAAGA